MTDHLTRKRKPKRLTNVVLNEISLVDEPASPGAMVTLWKRHDPDAIAPAPLAKALEAIPTTPTRPTSTTGPAPMPPYEKMLKAAASGMPAYGTREAWKEVMGEYVAKHMMPGETVEAASARLYSARDETFHAIVKMQRAAEPETVVKARHVPPPSALDTLAKSYADEHGCDFATAFSAVTQTPEGRRLWAESRRA